MKIEQIYTRCLAQGAYYVESDGEAIIIDPLREVQPYIEKAKTNGAKIKYVLETHFHADFVSGHKDLAKKTGATIVFGPTDMKLGFDAKIAKDEEIISFGKAKIKVLHTPGHTMESTCYLLLNEEGEEEAIFTGDTLFIGDVGRPDLAQEIIGELTQEKLAGYLYDSLKNKILPLPNNLIVYPAHGAGSACGKNMSTETSGSLGNQKKTNYALDTSLTKEDFIKVLITGLTPPPSYFSQNVMLNIKGYDDVDEVIERGNTALSTSTFEMLANETGAVMLDTRQPQTFAKGFIPNSINIGIDGSFAVWVGTLMPDAKQEILLITEHGREEEVATRLARVGFDNILGHLNGGFYSWKNEGKEIDTINSITVDEFNKRQNEGAVLDVRKDSEFKSEHILDAQNLPLDFINERLSEINKNKNYFVHCAGGYRSMIFSSILKAKGYDNFIEVQGGFSAIKDFGKFNVTEYVYPSTML
jgi:hydroxyacylglutathione hydrolase